MADDARPGDGRGLVPPDPTRDPFATTPVAVALTLLGILGGVCGEPVSVTLQNYPADLIGALQRLLREHVPPRRICEIFRPADLRRLGRGPHKYSLVLVYPMPGHLSAGLIAQWYLERDRRTRLPVVLLVGEQHDREAPGAVLGLSIGPAEVARLRGLLAGDSAPDSRVFEFLSRPCGPRMVATYAGLRPLFKPADDPLWVPSSLGSVQALRGLLAGHSLWRRLGVDPGNLDPLTPDLDDYTGVWDLLRNSRAGLPGEMGDPILAAMIRRANLYLGTRGETSRRSQSVLAGREGDSSLPTAQQGRRETARDRPIGLCELADLGNVRSALAKRLIKATLRGGDLEAITRLGLVRKLPEETTVGSLDGAAVARLMVAWSMKQVRTRFDRLRRQGFVQAERIPAGNGPWVIRLPEELKPLPGEFQTLPSVDRVAEACRREGSPPA